MKMALIDIKLDPLAVLFHIHIMALLLSLAIVTRQTGRGKDHEWINVKNFMTNKTFNTSEFLADIKANFSGQEKLEYDYGDIHQPEDRIQEMFKTNQSQEDR